MYLFILESIGTSELLLIGLVALVIFGPRKLPELARMLGKAMNEFRRTTDDFKETWTREVDFERDDKDKERLNSKSEGGFPRIAQASESNVNTIAAPQIQKLSDSEISEKMPSLNKISESKNPPEIAVAAVANDHSDKRDWL